jgi:hypothetical protein
MTFIVLSLYQPACSVAASAADLPSLPVCHLVATKRRPVMPSASRDTSQSKGGTMIAWFEQR